MAETKARSEKEDKTKSYPTPFAIEPAEEHKQTLILLHGRGDAGQNFGLGFLWSRTRRGSSHARASESTTFRDLFPNMRFLFPSAKLRRAKAYTYTILNQWFDNVPISEQDKGVTREQENWQLEGLQESGAFVRKIVEAEVELVGAENVFIGGLSQGCAMSLHLFLSYEGSAPLGGFVGMSGWLPFVAKMEELVSEKASDDHPPPASEVADTHSAALQVCNLVREIMELPSLAVSKPSCLGTPVLFGHGKDDQKVRMTKGLRAARLLERMEFQVTWKEYDEGHWYKVPHQIDDIVDFIQAQLSR